MQADGDVGVRGSSLLSTSVFYLRWNKSDLQVGVRKERGLLATWAVWRCGKIFSKNGTMDWLRQWFSNFSLRITWVCWLPPPQFLIIRSGIRSRTCISNKLLSDVDHGRYALRTNRLRKYSRTAGSAEVHLRFVVMNAKWERSTQLGVT